jgi:hypothetical protein
LDDNDIEAIRWVSIFDGGINSGSVEDDFGIFNESSTDETIKWRTEDISYSSCSICDIIDDKRHAILDRSSIDAKKNEFYDY